MLGFLLQDEDIKRSQEECGLQLQNTRFEQTIVSYFDHNDNDNDNDNDNALKPQL